MNPGAKTTMRPKSVQVDPSMLWKSFNTTQIIKNLTKIRQIQTSIQKISYFHGNLHSQKANKTKRGARKTPIHVINCNFNVSMQYQNHK